jgi:threonine/homoserine/homoserine lactone efflux protein
MVKPLQRLSVSFPIYVGVLAAISAFMPREQPRNLWGILAPLLLLVTFLAFGGVFVAALGTRRWTSRPILQFILPVAAGVAILLVASFLGVSLGAFIRERLR